MTPIRFHGLAAILVGHWQGGNRMVKMKDMNKQLVDRREFNRLCAALASSLPAVSAIFMGLSGA
jgi:hypothetical protein